MNRKDYVESCGWIASNSRNVGRKIGPACGTVITPIRYPWNFGWTTNAGARIFQEPLRAWQRMGSNTAQLELKLRKIRPCSAAPQVRYPLVTGDRRQLVRAWLH